METGRTHGGSDRVDPVDLAMENASLHCPHLGRAILRVDDGTGRERNVDVLLTGFGNTMGWIAILVISGAFIGEVRQASVGA